LDHHLLSQADHPRAAPRARLDARLTIAQGICVLSVPGGEVTAGHVHMQILFVVCGMVVVAVRPA
jgi:hypothetical protein